MQIICRQSALRCAALLFLALHGEAKRIPLKPLPPVVFDGIQYAVEGDGRDQYVVAADGSSSKVLWCAKIFHNHIRFWMEEDVQWIYITDLKLTNNSLLLRDERSRCYSVDLARRRVRKCGCGRIFLP